MPETNMINYDIYKSMKGEEEDFRILHDERYLDIFRMIDHSIIDFKVDEEKPFSKTMIVRKKQDGSTFSRELSQDSNGVHEFFAWAVQIFKVVYENKIVFADEMDRVLNPILSDKVISYICGKKHFGQFIFTTHNVLHLDLKNYMKEQIYFITKDIETLESELYSLADFPEIRYETTKIYEFYMKGILGVHPLSRKTRVTKKNFKVFCEGDTEYHYIDEMRRQKKLSIALKLVNMKGGGYSNFLEQIKIDGTANCLAKFIIIDGDRAIADEAKGKIYESF